MRPKYGRSGRFVGVLCVTVPVVKRNCPMEQPDSVIRIVGGRGPMTGSGKFVLAVAVAVVLSVLSWAAYRSDWAIFVYLGIMLIGNIGLRFVLNRTVVTGDGIRRRSSARSPVRASLLWSPYGIPLSDARRQRDP